MRGYSRAVIAGNLTRDPELRTTPSGASVCSFSVAVNRVYKDNNGEQKENVSFIDCSAWGKLGEMIAQYAKKGSSVLVSGRLDQRSYENKDGNRRSRTEIVADDFNFLGSRSDNSSSNYTAEPSATSAPVDDPMPDGEVDLSEVPF